MPARSNIAIADGAPTPLTHTFVPDGDIGPGHARFKYDAVAGVPTAAEFLTVRVTKSTSPAALIQQVAASVNPDVHETRLKYPSTYIDGMSSLTFVDFVDEVQLKRMCHPRSSIQRRKNMRIMISNLCAAANPGGFGTSWDNTETFW